MCSLALVSYFTALKSSFTSINMNNRARNKISNVQRDVLEALYREGMVGSGVNYKAKIAKAVEETGLTTSQVKKWIGNYKRTKKGDMNDQTEGSLTNAMKKVKAARGPSSFYLFCSDFFRRDNCKVFPHAEKIQMAANEWKQLSAEEKKKYERLSSKVKNVDINQLTDIQKDKLISRHTKRLLEEVNRIENILDVMYKTSSTGNLVTQEEVMRLAYYNPIREKAIELKDSVTYVIRICAISRHNLLIKKRKEMEHENNKHS